MGRITEDENIGEILMTEKELSGGGEHMRRPDRREAAGNRNRVQFLRQKVGITKYRLADLTHVDVRTVQRWEQEKNSTLSERTFHLNYLAHVFHVEPEYFTDQHRKIEDLSPEFTMALASLEQHKKDLQKMHEKYEEIIRRIADLGRLMDECKKLQKILNGWEDDHLQF